VNIQLASAVLLPGYEFNKIYGGGCYALLN
jgi:hypothetical protein